MTDRQDFLSKYSSKFFPEFFPGTKEEGGGWRNVIRQKLRLLGRRQSFLFLSTFLPFILFFFLSSMSSLSTFYYQSYFYNITRCFTTRKIFFPINVQMRGIWRKNSFQENEKNVDPFQAFETSSSVCLLRAFRAFRFLKAVEWSELVCDRNGKLRKEKFHWEEERESYKERRNGEGNIPFEMRAERWYSFENRNWEDCVSKYTLFQFLMYSLQGKLRNVLDAKPSLCLSFFTFSSSLFPYSLSLFPHFFYSNTKLYFIHPIVKWSSNLFLTSSSFILFLVLKQIWGILSPSKLHSLFVLNSRSN